MNILINNYCNLNCPYCFANDEMSTNCVKDMSIENFKICVEYCKKFNIHQLRLIGGEPTISSNFINFLEIGVNDNWFDSILVFTNLTFDSKIRDKILELNKIKHIHISPNINEFELLIPSHRKNIEENIEVFSKEYNDLFNGIGINIYKKNIDLAQWFDIIKKYPNIRELRYSIAVPSSSIVNSDNFDFYEYYHQFQDTLIKLSDFSALNDINISCDCNNVPICCLDDSAVSRIYKGTLGDVLSYSYICGYPIFDVCPDLTVLGCFGLSKLFNKKLTDFDTFDEIFKYFSSFDDKLARKECLNCIRYKRTGRSCSCISCHKVEV